MSSTTSRSQTIHPLLKKKILIDPYTKVENGVFDAFLIDFETFSIWNNGEEQSGLNLYYWSDDKKPLKSFYPFDPYFFVDCEDRFKTNSGFNTLKIKINSYQARDYKLQDHIKKIELVEVKDALHPNAKFLPKSKFVKITLDSPRSVRSKDVSVREDILNVEGIVGTWREADVTFEMRVSTDLDELIKIGRHYRVYVRDGNIIKIKTLPVDAFPDMPTSSFDLETCKQPMSSPNPNIDPIATIGVIFEDEGYILCNGEVIRSVPNTFIMGTMEISGKKVLHWEDVTIGEESFRKTHENCMIIDPIIYENEHITILAFMDMIAGKTIVSAGYNSDNFDWKYVAKRLEKYGGKMEDFGWKFDHFLDAYYIPGFVNLDVYNRYINQHSRLPEGEKGLKNATKKFFHFEPIDWDNVEALMRAMDVNSPDYDPETVVLYNGSDIYCTQLFLKKNVLPFFFSLTMDKPMNLFSISRRGNAIICGSGLLQRAHNLNILSPNRSEEMLKEGDLVEIDGKNYYLLKQSYKGAKVELNSMGIYRGDWKMEIPVDLEKIDELINDVEEAIDVEFSGFEKKGEMLIGIIVGEDENDKPIIKKMTKQQFVEQVKRDIQTIRDNARKITIKDDKGKPKTIWIYDEPLQIIHADVASLYPSLIITYKIQPHAIVDEQECNSCPFRESDPPCWYTVDWTQKFEVIDATDDERKIARGLLSAINDPNKKKMLYKYGIKPKDKIIDILKKVVKKRSTKFKEKILIPQKARICQKAHGFFVDEVVSVRADRYVSKYKMIEYDEKKREEEKKYGLFIETLAKNYSEMGNEVYTESGEIDLEKLCNCITETEEKQRELFTKTINEYRSKATFYNFIQEGKKAVLNSYYGYLFTIAVRWWSIIAAGCITEKGRDVLLSAINYTSCLAQLTEADTDGYYTLIPVAFPINFKLMIRKEDGSEYVKGTNVLSALLNLHCIKKFTNHNNYEPNCCADPHPYLTDENEILCEKCGEKVEWVNTPRCELKFDTDGPFDGMFVQTKKKYCLWNREKIVELKGMETKRNDAIEIQRKMIDEIVFNQYKHPDNKSLEEAYKKAEDYTRTIVKAIKEGTLPTEDLLQNTNVSLKCLKRLNNALEIRQLLERHEIKDFSFSYRDIMFLRIIEKYQSGAWGSYEMNAIMNSMGRNKDDPLYNLPIDVVQAIIDAYDGKELGINKGAQYMAAFRQTDMGMVIDEYSSVSFIKSKYPQGKYYEMNKRGKMVAKTISPGKSESVVPYAILDQSPEIVNEYIERWTGNDPQVKEGQVFDIIDFEAYMDTVKSLAERFIIDPAKSQGVNIYMGDLFDDKLYGTMKMDAFLTQGRRRRIIQPPQSEKEKSAEIKEAPKKAPKKEAESKPAPKKKKYDITSFLS